MSTWDGEHYLFISQNGYFKDQPSNAFYPLWPMTIYAASIFSGLKPLYAGLLMANIFLIIFLYGMYVYVNKHHGHQIAHGTILLYIVYPGSICFHFVYSESLFMLVFVCMLLALDKHLWTIYFLCGVCLSLVRPVGILITIPLGIILLERQDLRKYWVIAFGPIVGFALYLYFVYTYQSLV